ncbi:MAG: pyridoxal 5'-phosphate synthase glutaminase subunit PdxT, partial [Blastocatellia bacterium]|nr:pyridoxal 5'-phosphate synthase glutaminase subunit PdxT [Blastocatellia bacterium]
MEAVFIRAPRICRVGPNVEVLARLAGEPVFVREGNILAATFHPELSEDERAHRFFLEVVSEPVTIGGR